MAYLALFFSVIVWGISFVVTGNAIADFPFMLFINIRFILAALLLWGIIILTKNRKKIEKSDLKKMLALFLVQPVGYFAFETLGLKHTSPSNVSLILSLIPVFVMFMESKVNHEKLRLSQMLGVFVTVVATALFIWHDQKSSIEPFSVLGVVFALLAALSGAFYVILSRNLSDKYSSLQQTTYQFSFAAVFFIPFSMAQVQLKLVFSQSLLLSLAFLVVFCSVLGFLTMNYALKHIQSSKVSSILNLIPMVTVGTAVFTGKNIDEFHLIFMAFAILGIILANRKNRVVNMEY